MVNVASKSDNSIEVDVAKRWVETNWTLCFTKLRYEEATKT